MPYMGKFNPNVYLLVTVEIAEIQHILTGKLQVKNMHTELNLHLQSPKEKITPMCIMEPSIRRLYTEQQIKLSLNIMIAQKDQWKDLIIMNQSSSFVWKSIYSTEVCFSPVVLLLREISLLPACKYKKLFAFPGNIS